MDRVRTQQIASYRPAPPAEWRPEPEPTEQIARRLRVPPYDKAQAREDLNTKFNEFVASNRGGRA